VITGYSEQSDWAAIAAAATATLPDEPVTVVRGLAPPGPWSPDGEGYQTVEICRAEEQAVDGRCMGLLDSYGSSFGSDVLVGVDAVRALSQGRSPAELSQAREVLARGGVLVASSRPGPVTEVRLRLTRFVPGPDGTERAELQGTVTARAARLDGIGARAVIPEELADELGGSRPVAVAVGDRLTGSQEAALRRSVEGIDDGLSLRVERGYESHGDRTVLLVLASVAGLVVLGGTLAATSLALSEARPDLSTLGQVGARPRTRRAVAAGYALVLGLVGAGLGTLTGLIPGVAAAVSLTSNGSTGFAYTSDGHFLETPGFYLDIPWWLLALVLVVLPLVSAAVAAAATRSRLDGPTRALA
jgi:putative ABC transport system permease protein